MPQRPHRIIRRTTAFVTAACLGLLGLAQGVAVRPACAFPLRSPQVAFNYGPLQEHFNDTEPGMNVATDQLDSQVWDVKDALNHSVTLVLQSAAVAGTVGLYDASSASPQLIPIFPSGTVPLAYTDLVVMHDGTLLVTAFDAQSNLLGQTHVTGVDAAHVGFYVQDAQGTFYSQDSRNAGRPQALAYGSIAQPCGSLAGDLCVLYEDFSGSIYDGTNTFYDVEMTIRTMEVLPARPATWGSVKALYR